MGFNSAFKGLISDQMSYIYIYIYVYIRHLCIHILAHPIYIYIASAKICIHTLTKENSMLYNQLL